MTTESILSRAIDAANARKDAIMPPLEDSGQLTVTSEHESRALIGGYDIDYDEFTVLSIGASHFIAHLAISQDLSVTQAIGAAWKEGFLLGLMTAQISLTDNNNDPEK